MYQFGSRIENIEAQCTRQSQRISRMGNQLAWRYCWCDLVSGGLVVRSASPQIMQTKPAMHQGAVKAQVLISGRNRDKYNKEIKCMHQTEPPLIWKAFSKYTEGEQRLVESD